MPKAIAGLDPRKGPNAYRQTRTLESQFEGRLPRGMRIMDARRELTGRHLVAKAKDGFENSGTWGKQIVTITFDPKQSAMVCRGFGAGLRTDVQRVQHTPDARLDQFHPLDTT